MEQPTSQKPKIRKNLIQNHLGLRGNSSGLVSTCTACHGQNLEGNSMLGGPNLRNHNPWYFEEQISKYLTDKRGFHAEDTLGKQMAAIAKASMKDVNIELLSNEILKEDFEPTHEMISGNIENGKQKYNMVCGACHGPNGAGNKDLNAPSLVVLNDWYIKDQYQNFEKGIRGSASGDISGSQMMAIAQSGMLGEGEDLNDVIAFLRSLKEEK